MLTSARSAPEPVTLAAIGVMAAVLANLAHEGLGHGGACLLVGGKAIAISSAWFDCGKDALGPWAQRAVSASGTLVNLLVGGLLWLWLQLRPPAGGPGYYFLWITMTINLLQGGGYLMTSPLFGFGDWSAFLQGLAPRLPWQLGLTAAGVALSLLAVHQGSRLAAPLLGEEPARRRRVWLLCLIPYVAGGGLFVVAALFNPYGRGFMLTSGLAHFGGSAWLLWLPAWTHGLPPSPVLPVPRSWAWIGAGALAALFCLAVLGPAVRF